MAQLDTGYPDQRIVFPGDPTAKETANPGEDGSSARGELLVNRSHLFHPNTRIISRMVQVSG